MRHLVERHGPATPTGRLVVATLAAFIGIGSGIMFLFGLTASAEPATLAAILFIVGMFTPLAYWLASSVVRRAEEAPEPEWWGGTEARESIATDDADPIDVLKQRYAEGKLTTEEFEERVDRLVDHDGAARDVADHRDGTGELDREVERA